MKSIMDLMFMKAASSGGGTLVEKTVTGNPATFTTNVAQPLVSITIPIVATQEGSGTPSSSNVRPIVGQNGLIVYHSGEDTSNPETVTVFSGWQMYGGTINAITGELVVTHMYASLIPSGVYANFFYNTADGLHIPVAESTNAELMADRFKPIVNVVGNETYSCITFYANGIIRWVEPDCIGMTLNEYKQWLSENPSKTGHICYKLKEPITAKIDPQSITTLKGINKVWTNSSGTNTIVYLTKE